MKKLLFICGLAVFLCVVCIGCGKSVSEIKREMEVSIEHELRKKLDTDRQYRSFEMGVETVSLNQTGPDGGTKRDGKKVFEFDGAAVVIFDYDRYEVPVEAEADLSGGRSWKLKPKAFNFLKGVVYIPMQSVSGDKFNMGCTSEQGSNCYNKEKPPHNVTISSFLIGRYPITQVQWKQVMGKNPSEFKGDSLPVENVSWNDVQSFIKKLNSKSGKKYRLPTEAEWEYAARGGVKSKGLVYAGSNNIDDVAWYTLNSDDKTQTVGTKRPNELGIYDMSGNVWEWVNDRFGEYSGASETDPKGPSFGSTRVNRGGSWDDDARLIRVTSRGDNTPESRFNSLGFRLVRDI